MENSILLAEADCFQIIQFKSCGRVGVRCNNTLLSFTQIEYEKFVESYQKIRFERHSILFPDNVTRLIMNTPAHCIQLCFNEEEYTAFKQILTEAIIVLRAKTIINS
ncbi:MAG: hypothetical protein ED557_08685 [Balneola sp.]|nr:MAG: hypothetical protein ED557_08685 [Balneola sp.]